MEGNENVVVLDVVTRLPIPPERVVEALGRVEFETLVVIGRTKDGELYRAANTPDLAHVLYLMRLAEHTFISEKITMITEPC